MGRYTMCGDQVCKLGQRGVQMQHTSGQPRHTTCHPPCNGLLLVLGVGIWVVNHHRVTRLQVEAAAGRAAGSGRCEVGMG